MLKCRFSAVLGLSVACLLGMSSLCASAAVTPGITIAATNISAPDGNGTSTLTLTSVGGWSGTVNLTCAYTGSLPEPPICNPGTEAVVTDLAPAQDFIFFYAYGTPADVTQLVQPTGTFGTAPLSGMVLASGLLLGFGLRRKKQGWLAMMVLAVGTLAGMAALTACGGGVHIPKSPSGTYTYTITATNTANSANYVTTPVTVTVP